MTHRYAVSRRTLLRGAGAAVALPLLDVMRPYSDAAEPQKRTRRLAYLYFPNGVADGAWDPRRVDPQGTLQSLNRWMAPLEPYRQRLLMIRNMWTPGNGYLADHR